MRALGVLAAAGCLALASCASAPRQQAGAPPATEPSRPAAIPAAQATPPGRPVAKPTADASGAQRRGASPDDSGAQRRGAYYKDDGPGDNPPRDLASIPDAQPRAEPLHRWANRPYEVFGRTYSPLAEAASFRQRGRASWYGRRFHGQQTSSGEPYDMYGMTGAHPTLPIPSYVRVTSVANGRSVVVRINDRGPFHPDRILDLSYTAAAKLGFVEAGSAEVDVSSVTSGATQTAAATPPAGERAERSAAPDPAAASITSIAAPVATPAGALPAAGVYLQVGAFSARDNAESFRVRLYRELAWLNDAVQIVPGGSAFRLHVGPYQSRNDAQAIADRIRAELNFNPIFVIR